MVRANVCAGLSCAHCVSYLVSIRRYAIHLSAHWMSVDAGKGVAGNSARSQWKTHSPYRCISGVVEAVSVPSITVFASKSVAGSTVVLARDGGNRRRFDIVYNAQGMAKSVISAGARTPSRLQGVRKMRLAIVKGLIENVGLWILDKAPARSFPVEVGRLSSRSKRQAVVCIFWANL